MSNGLFLVIEGTDGSGKGTQFDLLKERLTKEGYDVASFDFPQYDKESSYFVREYLNGNYGHIDQVGPYTASLFYALDRYEAASEIRQAINEGKVVIANRFTGSNMAHQGTKFTNAAERKGYFLWLDAIEFQMLNIPRPDISVVLRVPAETAQSLVDKKAKRSYTDKKRDIHEADLDHLTKSVQVYDNLCELFPKDFKSLDCVRNDQLLDIDTVHNLIWETITPLLPAKKRKAKKTAAIQSKTTDLSITAHVDDVAEQPIDFTQKDADGSYRYHIPENFDPQTRQSYVQIMDSIFNAYTKIVTNLTDTNALESASAVLPTAAKPFDHESLLLQQPAIISPLQKLVDSELPVNYAAETEPVRLVSAWPRNELDILPDMLYEYSALSLHDIEETTSQWSYDKKLTTFQTYLSERFNHKTLPGRPLEKIRYSWDLVTDYATLRQIHNYHYSNDLSWQHLSPRYGYAVPEDIVEAGLTDTYEYCFDQSLKLYSILQSAGYDYEAQYAILLGHRVRWKATLNSSELLNVLESNNFSGTFTNQLHASLSETHPLIARTIQLHQK